MAKTFTSFDELLRSLETPDVGSATNLVVSDVASPETEAPTVGTDERLGAMEARLSRLELVRVQNQSYSKVHKQRLEAGLVGGATAGGIFAMALGAFGADPYLTGLGAALAAGALAHAMAR